MERKFEIIGEAVSQLAKTEPELVRGRRRRKNLVDLAGRVTFAPGFDRKQLRDGRRGVDGAGE